MSDDATPAYWVHDLSPFLIQFNESIGIRYYGLSYLLGFILGGWILWIAAKQQRLKLPPAAVMDLMTALVIGVMLGGRMGYFLLYDFGSVMQNPLQLVRVWEGGMSSHGGFVGVALAMWWFTRKRDVSYWNVADTVASVAPLGIGLGRVANFINGELWGRVTDVSWAVIFPASARPGTPLTEIAPRHPSQLYAAACEGFLIFAYVQWRLWRTPVAQQSPGRMAGEFLIIYAVARSITEMFREPDAPLMFGLTRGTFYSVFLLITGAWVIRRSGRSGASATS